MSDKLDEYRRADGPLPEHNLLWPLYGAGMGNLGRDGQLIQAPIPEYGPDELLVRHDAVGICFSDIKVIRSGEAHPRIYKDMRSDPVVLGHEVSLTVVGVGENLKDRYKIGDRFVIQADIYVDGISRAYGYDLQGGFSQYNVIGEWVLAGDHGCYLIPVKSSMGYAESALTEPWACVEASYTVTYRTAWLAGGTVWLVGDGNGARLGAAKNWRPGKIVLDLEDADFAARVRAWALKAGIEVQRGAANPSSDETSYDDIVVLGKSIGLVERAASRLAKGGILNMATPAPFPRPGQVDIGRLHYDHLMFVGTTDPDLSRAYIPVRSQLKPGGILWVLGAAGPMGHMHIQRAIEIPNGPKKIVATNLRQPRILEVEQKFEGLARERGIALRTQSRETLDDQAFEEWLRREMGEEGFDDIVVLAPSVTAIEEAARYLGKQGVMNVFAGLPRGTPARLELNGVVRRGVRFTGTSGSSIDDLRNMRDLAENHTLSPNRSVAAIAGLVGVADGLQAVADGRFPGKVVIFPQVKSLPLTPLDELQDALPSVFARLKNGKEWTVAAEEEFLRRMLA